MPAPILEQPSAPTSKRPLALPLIAIGLLVVFAYAAFTFVGMLVTHQLQMSASMQSGATLRSIVGLAAVLLCILAFAALATELVATPTEGLGFTGRCGHCDYDLTGLPRDHGQGQCPECSTRFDEHASATRLSRHVNTALGIRTVGVLVLCFLAPIFVDAAWALLHLIKGHPAARVFGTWGHTDGYNDITTRGTLCLQLFAIVGAIALLKCFIPVARPLAAIARAQALWIIIFIGLSLPGFPEHWWWPTSTWTPTAAWIIFPFYAAAVLYLTLRTRISAPTTTNSTPISTHND